MAAEQGTPEWRAERAGKITASRIADMLATIKTGESASRRNYRAELVAERLSGSPIDSFVSSAMKWGIEQEIFARAAYEMATGKFVDNSGFIDHPAIKMCGASPDGLIEDDGIVEIKCPNTDTHISYLKAGKVPSEYEKQMMWQMAVTGRKWNDFVSFDPRMPVTHQLFVRRLYRDDEKIKAMSEEVIKFGKEVDEECAAVLKSEPILGTARFAVRA